MQPLEVQRTFESAAEEMDTWHTAKDRVTALLCPPGTPHVLTGKVVLSLVPSVLSDMELEIGAGMLRSG
jgi:hypothetical protein